MNAWHDSSHLMCDCDANAHTTGISGVVQRGDNITCWFTSIIPRLNADRIPWPMDVYVIRLKIWSATMWHDMRLESSTFFQIKKWMRLNTNRVTRFQVLLKLQAAESDCGFWCLVLSATAHYSNRHTNDYEPIKFRFIIDWLVCTHCCPCAFERTYLQTACHQYRFDVL